MKTIRKLGLAAVVLAALFALTSCAPAAEPGGTVLIGGQEPGAPVQEGGQQAQQPAAAGNGQQQAQQPAPGFDFFIFMPIALIAIMYLLIIRPQRKQAKAAREMQAGLSVGDNVVTTSGFFGKIVGVGTDSFLVEFGEGRGFKVWVRKGDIAGIKSPVMTPPASETDSSSKDK